MKAARCVREGVHVSTGNGRPVPTSLFEISDVFISIGIVLVCGVLLYMWWTMMFLLVLFLGAGPIIKKKYPKGIFLHYPHRKFGMSLPGIVSPGLSKKWSD